MVVVIVVLVLVKKVVVVLTIKETTKQPQPQQQETTTVLWWYYCCTVHCVHSENIVFFRTKNISHIYHTITHKHSIKLFHRAVICFAGCFAYAPGFSEIFSRRFFPLLGGHFFNMGTFFLDPPPEWEKNNVFRTRVASYSTVVGFFHRPGAGWLRISILAVYVL